MEINPTVENMKKKKQSITTKIYLFIYNVTFNIFVKTTSEQYLYVMLYCFIRKCFSFGKMNQNWEDS